MNNKPPVLFERKDQCCACGACVNACPRDAISMVEDECGFLYPSIDPARCVGCGKCQNVCAFQNPRETHQPLRTCVAVSRDKEILRASSSGGAFASLAKAVIGRGGCAVGAAFQEDFTLAHIIAEDEEALKRLQGSKYAQSQTGLIFREVDRLLKREDREVLFSGCPCQVAALRAYLGREDPNLLTVDLVCHGVPSNRMLKDFLACIEGKNHVHVRQLSFRDKKYGWGKSGTILTDDGRELPMTPESPNYRYYDYFLKGYILRENCHRCPYACSNRPGDLTLGDYWGLGKEHPELLLDGGLDKRSGISVVIANTERGAAFLDRHAELFELFDSTFEKAARGNDQLNAPVPRSGARDRILRAYAKRGWRGVEFDYRFSKFKGRVKRKLRSIARMVLPRKPKDI